METFRYRQAAVECGKCRRICLLQHDTHTSKLAVVMGDPCETDEQCRKSLLRHAKDLFAIPQPEELH